MSSDHTASTSASPGRRTAFVDDVLAGRARIEDMDDYIDEWGDTPDDAPDGTLEIYEYLGLTWEEYKRWGSHPESLRFVLASRVAGLSVTEVLEHAQVVGAAARSTDSSDAQRALNWLMDRGRISTQITNI